MAQDRELTSYFMELSKTLECTEELSFLYGDTLPISIVKNLQSLNAFLNKEMSIVEKNIRDNLRGK